jgi:hypothetical protein
LLQALAVGPSSQVTNWNRYSINGFNFHTYEYGKNKCSINYGIFIKSTNEADFYGILDEIIELSYYGSNRSYKTILFKCTWMDNSPRVMCVHKLYKIVEVNRKERYSKKEPFALGHQAYQVYFAPYPNTKNERRNWEVVFKTNSRTDFDAPVEMNDVFQEEAISKSKSLLSTINIDEIVDIDDINDVDNDEVNIPIDMIDENEEELESEEDEDDEDDFEDEEEDESDDIDYS